MPLAKSEGFGAEDEIAIELNDQIIPATVATSQSTASKMAAPPTQSIQHVARVFSGCSDVTPGL